MNESTQIFDSHYREVKYAFRMKSGDKNRRLNNNQNPKKKILCATKKKRLKREKGKKPIEFVH